MCVGERISAPLHPPLPPHTPSSTPHPTAALLSLAALAFRFALATGNAWSLLLLLVGLSGLALSSLGFLLSTLIDRRACGRGVWGVGCGVKRCVR